MAVDLLAALEELAPGAVLLVPGSAAQYGLARPEPLPESAPLAPVSAYGAIKCVLECMLTAAPLASGRVIFARAFNHAGPGQPPTAPVAAWAHRIAELEALGGGVLRVGSLDGVRDFLDVRDVADAYLTLTQSTLRGAVNVCSGQAVTLRGILDELISMAEVPVDVHLDETLLRTVDPPFVVGDPGRLRAATGWAPKRALAETLADTLAEARAAGVAGVVR
jgi:GDP-4-dehydro-6-deoxy-D-mannose reductase